MQNLSPIQQMIGSGQFGVNAPMENYNPYIYQQPSNIIPIGNYYQPQQQSYVFQPIGGYQQQPQYQYYHTEQPNSDYYNPYGNMYQQPQYYPNYEYQQNPYIGYNNYNGYKPFISPMQRQHMVEEQVTMMKIKYRMVNNYFHRETNEEELDRRLNPQNKANIPTEEEIKNAEEVRFFQYVDYLSTQPQVNNPAIERAMFMRQMSANWHKELDDHSLCQFLMDDLWKIEREDWIRNNIKVNQGRNLSTVYNSSDYNELLNMHRSSNPYITDILSNSRYDNNINDLEVGMNAVYDRAQRRKAILEGKVPTFISSDETQKRRAEWTKQIIDQIYRKGGTVPNV